VTVATSSGPTGSSPGSATSEVGGGVITGTVKTKDGRPLEGALVRAEPMIEWKEPESPDSDLPPGSPPSSARGEIRRRAVEEYYARSRAGRREAVTDAQGRYALEGLADKAYNLEAWRAHYRIEMSGSEGWRTIAVGRACHFRAIPVRAVRVAVLLPDGGVPEHARISWTASEGGANGSSPWRSEEPRIVLDHGTYGLTATIEPNTDDASSFARRFSRRPGDGPTDFASYTSDSQTVSIGEGDLPDLTFQLKGQPGLHVKVLYPTEEHPRSVRIAAVRLEPGKPANPSRLLQSRGVSSLWLEEKTEGALHELEPGTYLVGATFRGNRLGPTATATVGETTSTVELRVPPGDLRDWVRVWVRAPDGALVTDASLQVGSREGDQVGTSPANEEPEPEGSYRVEHYSSDGMNSRFNFGMIDDDSEGDEEEKEKDVRCTWFVKAVSPRFGSAEAAYDPVGDREVTISFAAPAALRVVVAGWAESPDRERASLTLEPKPESGSTDENSETAVIGPAGTATFPPRKPGKYELVLGYGTKKGRRGFRSYGWGDKEVSRTPLTLSTGETTVTVAMATLHELVVHFKGDTPNLQSVEPDGSPGDQGSSGSLDGEGVLRFSDLKPGRYRLVTQDGDMWLDVPSSGPVSFRVNPFNSYRLKVEEEGYLHGLGLKTGDLVVAVNGAEFKDRATMDAAFLLSLARESSTFTVLRDGQKFDVTGDVRKLQEDNGSDVQPWAR
jgi:hypothetical protein